MHYLSAALAVPFFFMGISTSQAQSPSQHDWSGYYIGGDIGGVLGKATPVTSVLSSGNYFTDVDPEKIADAGSDSLYQTQLSGGIRGGFMQPFGDAYFGFEMSANTLALDQDRSASRDYAVPVGTQFNIDQSVEADWMISVRPRLGWGRDNWLGYVTGGFALTQLKIEHTFRDNANAAFSRISEEELAFGVTLGFGGEYALNDNWALRAEYAYTNFAKTDATSRVAINGGFTADLDHSDDLETHMVTVGLTYRFNGM